MEVIRCQPKFTYQKGSILLLDIYIYTYVYTTYKPMYGSKNGLRFACRISSNPKVYESIIISLQTRQFFRTGNSVIFSMLYIS
jgi:hypothetical protein